jgi:hypothetical protein
LVPRLKNFESLRTATLERRVVTKYNILLRAQHFLVLEGYSPPNGERQKRFASLIGDREPIVLYKQLPGMGRAKRYTITIADDNRAPLNKLCGRLIAAGSTCDVPRNGFGRD